MLNGYFIFHSAVNTHSEGGQYDTQRDKSEEGRVMFWWTSFIDMPHVHKLYSIKFAVLWLLLLQRTPASWTPHLASEERRWWCRPEDGCHPSASWAGWHQGLQAASQALEVCTDLNEAPSRHAGAWPSVSLHHCPFLFCSFSELVSSLSACCLNLRFFSLAKTVSLFSCFLSSEKVARFSLLKSEIELACWLVRSR